MKDLASEPCNILVRHHPRPAPFLLPVLVAFSFGAEIQQIIQPITLMSLGGDRWCCPSLACRARWSCCFQSREARPRPPRSECFIHHQYLHSCSPHIWTDTWQCQYCKDARTRCRQSPHSRCQCAFSFCLSFSEGLPSRLASTLQYETPSEKKDSMVSCRVYEIWTILYLHCVILPDIGKLAIFVGVQASHENPAWVSGCRIHQGSQAGQKFAVWVSTMVKSAKMWTMVQDDNLYAVSHL